MKKDTELKWKAGQVFNSVVSVYGNNHLLAAITDF